jgi:hypothetical protein
MCHEQVVACISLLCRQITKKGYVRHQLDVWRPKRRFAKLLLVNEHHSERQLFPIVVVLSCEKLRMVFIDFEEHGVREAFIQTDDHTLWHKKECLSVRDRLRNLSTNEPSFKKARIGDLWTNDPDIRAPLDKSSAFLPN